MKYLIFIVLIIINFNGCKAQNKTTMRDEILIPQVTKELEEFDITYYNENKKNGEIRNYDKNGLIIFLDYAYGYSIAEYFQNSYFFIVKNYYLNGNIEIKGVRFNNGSEYGVWFKFNEEGKLIEEIDMDAGYDYDWNDVIEYCAKKNIELTKGFIGSGGVPTEIYKTVFENQNVWQIKYYDKKAEIIFQIILDSKNGKLLNKKELKLI